MTTSASRGIETVTSLRLCSRAPLTTISDWRDITPLHCREANGRSPCRDLRSDAAVRAGRVASDAPTMPEPHPLQASSPAPDGRAAAAEQGASRRGGASCAPGSWSIVIVAAGAQLPAAERAGAAGAAADRPLLARTSSSRSTRTTSSASAPSARPSPACSRRRCSYPDAEADATDKFATQIPAFANGDELEALLREKDVIIDAKPIDPGRGVLLSILLGFGPVILLIGLFVDGSMRRGGGGGLSPPRRASAARARAAWSRRAAGDVRRRRRHRRGQGRAAGGRRLPQEPRRATSASAAASRAACCSPASPAPARRCWRAPWPARPACRSSRSRRRSSSRRSSASAPAACATCSRQAKEAAPAIIFIDELDAVGRARSGGAGFGTGSNDEREQTLNQILTEMDGFESDATVIVLGATNRPEVLDSALLRPGRFDRRVTVPPPDLDGRRSILEVHTRSLPLAADVRPRPARGGDARAWSAPTSPTSATRRRCWPRAATTRRSSTSRLHGRAGEDHPRRAAQDGHVRGGPAPHRLPRGGPRDRRHAHPGRRPGAQGVDHPPRARARRHVLLAGQRPHLLRPRGARRQASTS